MYSFLTIVLVSITFFPIFSTIVWSSLTIARKLSVSSLLVKGFIVGLLASLVAISLIVYFSGDITPEVIVRVSIIALTLTAFSVGVFWLTIRIGWPGNVLIPGIILSCVFYFTLAGLNAVNSPGGVQDTEAVQPSTGYADQPASDFEKQVLGIMHELERKRVLSDLPANLDHMLLGSSSSLSPEENLQLLSDSARLYEATLKAINELERRVGKNTFMDLLIESYFSGRVSFLDTAGLDYVGRRAFFAEVQRLKNQLGDRRSEKQK